MAASITVPNVGKIIALANLTGGTLTYHLFQAGPTDDRNAILADFTESDYEGYADQIATSWTTPVIDVNNYADSTADVMIWQPTGGSQPAQDALGYYVTASGDLVYFEYFDVPEQMNDEADGFALRPDLKAGSIDRN